MSTLSIQQKTNCDHNFIVENPVSSANATSLTDSTKNFPIDIWKDKKIEIVEGKGAGQSKSILSNTATQLFLVAPWVIIPDETSVYRGFLSSTIKYCPKCGNTGKYNDITFVNGQIKTVFGVNKFAQDVETLVLTPRGSSTFNKDLGAGLEIILSSDVSDDDEINSFIESNLRDAFTFYSQEQQSVVNIFEFENAELFGQIVNFSSARNENDQTILELNLEVSAASGDTAPVTSPLLVR